MSVVPIDIPKVVIDQETKQLLAGRSDFEGCVIVHCTYYSSDDYELIRIWKSTFLIDRKSGHKSRLVHAENISFYPVWTPVIKGTTFNFTLFFSRLPKNCAEFDLLEEIPQKGGFFIKGIIRNKSDVYFCFIN